MRFVTRLVIFSLLAAFIAACDPAEETPSAQQRIFVTIGTGGVTGVYYPTGGAISRMINQQFEVYKIKATVESTGGSVYNINAVMSGDLHFGIAQSDRQYQAYYGKKEWQATGPQKDLRSVFAIHPESITLIASADSGILGIRDLKGQRVNLGNPGSGQLGNSLDTIGAFGLSEDSFKARYVKAVEAPGLIQDEQLDAFFYTVGHPNGNIKEATSGRIKVRLIPIEGPEIEALIKKSPYYTTSVIPGKLYPDTVGVGDVSTFGVNATLVTSIKVPQKIVYAVTKEIFENLETFKRLHPAYDVLTRETMLQGLTAPLHPGAVKYYEEADLIRYINPSLLP